VVGGGLLLGAITFLSNAPPVFYSVSSLLLGIGVSKLVNSRKERKTRRREADLKIISEAYDPIYKDLTLIWSDLV
jgi:hypothetical protein